MKKSFHLLIIIILIFLTFSCADLFEGKTFVSVNIINHTDETIKVNSGVDVVFFDIIDYKIKSGQSLSISVQSGKIISATGLTTNKSYGSRMFHSDQQWDIY
jgi:hypothetical protein